MQIRMVSGDEAAAASCVASIFDTMGQLSDTHTLTFSVNPNPPGSVRSTAVMCILHHCTVDRVYSEISLLVPFHDSARIS